MENIKDVRELVEVLSTVFEEKLSIAPDDNRIKNPFFVVYGGKNSAQYDELITGGFSHFWSKARANKICRAIRNGNNLTLLDGDCGICSAVDNMYGAAEYVFSDYGKLTAFVIYDSRDFENADALKTCYETDINDIPGMFSNKTVDVVRFIILDRSMEMNAFRNEMRGYLREKMTDDVTRSTFLFENVLRTGRSVPYEPVYELIGKIIISGCASGRNGIDYDVFGLFSDKHVRTAALKKDERPNYDISATAVERILVALENYFSVDADLPADKVAEKLNIADNGYPFTNIIYDEIKAKFCSDDVIEHIPTAGEVEGKISEMASDEFRNRTCGSFDLFFDKYYLSVINNSDVQSIIRMEIRKHITTSLSPVELYCLSGEVKTMLQDRLKRAERMIPAGQKVKAYIEYLIKNNIQKCIFGMFINIMNEVQSEVRAKKALIDSLRLEYSNYILVHDPKVKNYYETKIDNYLSSSGKDSLDKITLDIGTSKETAIDVIYDLVIKMIDSFDELKLSYEDERQNRLKDNAKVAVRTLILNDVAKEIYFMPRTDPESLCRVTHMRADAESELFRYLKEKTDESGAIDYFINNGNMNGIVAIQLFALTDSALM